MQKQKRGRGRPKYSIDQLMAKRQTLTTELAALRSTQWSKRSSAQKKRVLSIASYICRLNRRMETGETLTWAGPKNR
jgi:hypothetical protein